MNEQGVPSPSTVSSPVPAPTAPLTFGQILDRVYRLTRTHCKLFFGIAVVPTVAVILFLAAMMSFEVKMIWALLAEKHPGSGAIAGGVSGWFLAFFVIAEPVLLLVYALYLPAAIHAAVQADIGVTVTFREAYRAAWSRFGRYLWLMILGTLYLVVPVGALAAVMGTAIALMHHAVGTASSSSFPFFIIPLIVLLYLCIFIYSILILLRFALAYPACMEEGLTAWAALRRSVQLTRGAKVRIFLVILVVYAAVYAAQLVCMLVLGVLAALVALGAMLAHVAVGSAVFFVLAGLGALGYLVMIIVTALLVYAALTTALAVIYHDQRRRMDGLAVAPAQAG